MMTSLAIGATGMMAQQLHVETISNNLANMTTTGFKKSRPEFQDLLYQTQRRIGSASSEQGTIVPAGVHVGLGVKTAAVYRVHEQGTITITDGELDVAIQGEGYFVIQKPDGETAYTRSGNFQRSNTGQIVTADGFLVQPGITIPQDAISVSINANGGVSVRILGQIGETPVGQLQLANFVNDSGLESIGDNLFVETAASGAAQVGAAGDAGFGTLLQRALETSNVNAVSEITALITAQRAYDLNSRVISTSDEMLQTVVQLR